MKTNAKKAETGAYHVRLYSGEGWFVQDADGKDVAGPYAEQKTAARKARAISDKGIQSPEVEEGDVDPVDVQPAPAAPKERIVKRPKAKAKASPEPAPSIPDPELVTGEAMQRIGTSAERHKWLEKARALAVLLLKDAGLEVPDTVRISIGMPFRSGRETIGQCWHKSASEDGSAEVFVSPVLKDGETILGVLVHELIHAALPDGEGHGKTFGKYARAVGLEGKLTAISVGEALKVPFAGFLADNGPYPGAAINPAAAGGKKQGTRMLKASCKTCEYTVRLTKKWAVVALPLCPNPACPDHGTTLYCEACEEPGEEEGEG